MPQSKLKTMPAAQREGQHSFRISKPTINTRKRAKFDGKRREEVKAVRNRRSCLRCSLLKIKCSDDELCTTCEQLSFVTRKHEKQTLSFCGCIRTRLSEVSVFEVYIAASGARKIGNEKSIAPTLASISLEFGAQVTWDLGALVDDIVDWLNNPRLSETSKVGTLSSPRFLELVSESSGQKAGGLFQQMIYSISRAYTRNDGALLTAEELHQFGSMAGHDFLAYLDQKLKPTSLAGCSHNDMRALFLWVFGTILAVGYAEPSSGAATREHASTLKAMQNHLCQILAHYLIFLGSQLNLPIKTGTDQFLLEAAPSRWHRQGQFEWKSPNHSCSFPSNSNPTYYSQHDSSSRIFANEAASHVHENEDWVRDQEPDLQELQTLITFIGDSHSQLLRLESCVSRISRLMASLRQESSLPDHVFNLDEGVESHQGYSAPNGGGESSTWPFQQDGVSRVGSMPQGDSRTSGSGLGIASLCHQISESKRPFQFRPLWPFHTPGVSDDMPTNDATRAESTYQSSLALQHLCRGVSRLARREISSETTATAQLFSPGKLGGLSTSQSTTNVHDDYLGDCHAVSSPYLPKHRCSEAQSPGGKPIISKNCHVLDSEYLWGDGCIECGSYEPLSSSGRCIHCRYQFEEFEEESDAETQYLLV